MSFWFRLIRFRSPLLTESRFLSFPRGTEMFQFPGLAAPRLWIQRGLIRGSRSQRSFDSFTGLIAVFHALLRLLAPRHPPHALSSLAALIPLSEGLHRSLTLPARLEKWIDLATKPISYLANSRRATFEDALRRERQADPEID